MTRRTSEPRAAGGRFPLSRDGMALMLVVGLALALRLVWLDRLPTNLTADEADNLAVVLRIAETGQPGPFGLDWKPAPAFSVYLLHAFTLVLGDTPFGLRAASALLSTVALLPFYALARRVVRPAAALGATVLLASGQWYLHFSRSGWENVHTALYALLAAWALTVALEHGRLRWFLAAGGAAALGLYGYFAGRLILPALVVYAPLAIARERKLGRRVLLGCCAVAVTAALLFVPQALTAVDRWDEFGRRTAAVDVLRQPRPYLGETSDLGVLRVQLQRTLAAFVLLDGSLFDNDRYGPLGEPLYDPATGGLLLLGLALGIRRWRATALWWSMLFVPLLGTQVLSTGTPDGARAIVAAPFVYLFVALAIDRLLSLAPRSAIGAAHLALVVGVVLVAGTNARSYFTWISSPVAAAARQPAVELHEYGAWRETMLHDIRAGGHGFNVGQWHTMRPLPTPVQPEPPGPRLAPSELPPRDLYRSAAALPLDLFQDPRAIAVGPDGTIYVADAGRRAVLRLAPDGTVHGTLGEGQLHEPVAIAVRATGDLDVLDAESGQIVRLAPDGSVRQRLGATHEMYRPRGLALAANGDIYVADTGRQRLLVLTADGRLRRTIGGAGRFDQPSQVVLTADGGLLVAEPQRRAVQLLDGSGRRVAQWPISTQNTIHGPALALGPSRTVLVADPDAGSVRLVTYDGRPVAEVANTRTPGAVAFGPRGAIYVIDRDQRALVRYEPAVHPASSAGAAP